MEDSRAAAVVAASRQLNGSASPIANSASPMYSPQQQFRQQQQQARPREHRGSPNTAAPRAPVAPELQRAPTWARNIDFDDGFDLKSASPSAPLHDAASFSPILTTPSRVDASPPALAHASPGAPHFRSYSGGDKQEVGLDGPPGFAAARNAAFAHPAHARVASTDIFRGAPGKGSLGRPGTGSSTASSPRMPQTASSGSPQSTQGPASERSTPKAVQSATMGTNGQASGSNASLPQPQQPSYMQPTQHPLQQTRVPSRSASPEWARVQSYSGSSADLYAAGPTLEQLGSFDVASAGGSRSGGSMSGDEREYGYANGNPKRGSVLSFQTAMSGSFASAAGTESSQEHLRSGAIDVQGGASPAVQWGNDSAPGQGPYGISPEDAIPGALPGGWGGRGWAPTPPPKPDSAASSPRTRLTPIDSTLASKQLPEQPYNDPRTPVARKVSIPLSAEAALALPPMSSDAPTQDLDDTVLLPGTPGVQREVTITPSHVRSASKQSQQLPPLPQGPPAQETLSVAPLHPAPTREASTTAQEASTAPSKPPVEAPLATPRESTSTSTSTSTAVVPPSSRPPALPEKELSPRVPTKDIFPASYVPLTPSAEVTLPSDEPQGTSPGLLSDNVIPPPLPASTADIARPGDFERAPSSAPEPVSDFRARPLANVQASPISPAQQQQSINTSSAGVAGLGTQRHSSPVEITPIVRGPQTGFVRAALAEAPAAPAASRSDEESVETPPREDSPPPEGEVEARAEWERAQAKQIAGASAYAGAAGRKSIRGSLKPLQYVSSTDAREGSQTLFAPKYTVDANGVPAEISKSEQGNPLLTAVGAPAPALAVRRGSSGQLLEESKSQQSKARSGSGVMSTQQLQRLQARDQRRSVGAINMTMGAADVAGGSNGPYPAFPSPSTSATKAGTGRQYPGTLPQRSLVAPFELQQRPDGLLSGLIGPDGVRRSPNDPEVCLECMMRDEDMIDVHVLGPGLWERESDRGFEEACQIEREEDERKARDHEAKQAPSSGAHTVESSNGLPPGSDATHPRDSIPMPPRPTGTRIRVKRVAHGDPLTAERLKLHTQMNPPASSHRWRTLQTFLAIQAKYIAMEQRARAAAGLERELPSRPTPAPVVTPSDYDNRMVRTGSDSGPVEGLVSKLSTKNRGQRSSTSLLKDAGFHLEEEDLAPADREAKERDIAHAREARRKVASANSAIELAAAASRASYIASSPAPSPVGDKYPIASEDEARRTLSTPLKEEDASSLQSSQRRSMAPTPTPFRAGSAQDARSTQGALHATLPNDPSSPASLVPPSRPFAPSTGGSVNRAAASSLSLAPSGSMIDMHVGLEDRNEHRISQAGFMPGSPLAPASPGTMNRAYYGFPGDGEADDSAVMPSADSGVVGRYSHPDERDESRDVSLRETSSQKKKKGLRGFFSKITGGSNRRSGSQGFAADNGSRGDESSKVSQSSLTGSPRAKRSSLAAQNSLDMQPPAGPAFGSVRTRPSESSLGPQASLEEEDEMPEPGETAPYLRSPGMISQMSFEDMAPAISGDMGPFQSGPTIAPRTESRLPPAPTPSQASPRAPSRQSDVRGLRNVSSASYITNKARPISGGVLPVVSSNGPAFVAPSNLPKRTTSRGGSTSGPTGIPRMGSVTGLDGQARAPNMNGDLSNTPGDRASVASRVSRKDPPSMPPGMSAHSRGSSAGTGATPADPRYASGYSSTNSPLTSSLPGFENQTQQQQQRQSMQTKQRMPPPPLILEPYTRPITPSGPARPPRSPRRSDMTLGEDVPPPVPPHQSMAMRSQTPTQQMQQPAHHFHTSPRLQNMASTGAMAGAFQNSPPPREGTPQRQSYALDLATPVKGKDKDKDKDKTSRKSRFLSRFNFKWTKRDAAKLPPTPRVGEVSSAEVPLGFDGKPRVIPMYTTKAAKQPPRAVDDLAGLAPPRFNFNDRARAVSTPNDDRLPPRSQSALGMLPSQGFRSNFPGFRSRSRAAMLDEDSDE